MSFFLPGSPPSKGWTMLDRIEEIRVEEVFDEENDQYYYFVYYFKNQKINLIGKSSVKPVCYRQIVRYCK
jgi:hypothetical protein